MKLFVGNDYTFCMSEDCYKKESCVRWKGHYEKADGFDLREVFTIRRRTYRQRMENSNCRLL